jgi:hypothetical protein
VVRTRGERYRLTTSVTYDRTEDAFDLKGVLESGEASRPDFRDPRVRIAQVEQMESHYRVDRSGRLHTLAIRSEYAMRVPEWAQLVHARVEVWGGPKDGRFTPELRATIGRSEVTSDRLGDPVQVSVRGTVLNPLHPPSRIPGLALAQTWTCALIDPFCSGAVQPELARSSLGKTEGVVLSKAPMAQVVRARVRDEYDTLVWPKREKIEPRVGLIVGAAAEQAAAEPLGGPRNPVSCLLINFGEDDSPINMTMWVRASDGIVLQLQAVLEDGSWTITRNP